MTTTQQNNWKMANRPRGGYALVIVLGVTLAATALAAVQVRYLQSALHLEQARIEAENHSNGSLTVLAIAITRLETGNPPATTYQFDHTVNGETMHFLITYLRSGGRWRVTASPAPSLTGFPFLPASF